MRSSMMSAVLLLVAVGVCLIGAATVLAQEVPDCDFHDTVRLNAAQRRDDGSFEYEGVIIPAHLVGNYSYYEKFGGDREPVKPHLRGCVCKLRPCLRYCCHPRRFSTDLGSPCNRQMADELHYSTWLNVTFANGTTHELDVAGHFVPQMGFPCTSRYLLTPEIEPDHGWKLFENGTLLRMYDMEYMSRRDYCFWPNNATGEHFTLSVVNCAIRYDPEQNIVWNSIGMLISAPFMLITAFVYLWIPELRNLHGKCLVCYLIPMAIGYFLLGSLTWVRDMHGTLGCAILGFTTYFCFVSAFLWLSVISYDLWHNFRGTGSSGIQRLSQRRRFLVYSLYAWGLTAVLTAIMIVCQYSGMDDKLKPGIGGDYCWLKPTDWSAMIYFYGLMLVIIIFNTIMFVLTALKVLQLKRKLQNVENNEGHMRLVSQKQMFMLFLRLFILMGISWLLEVIAYVSGPSPIFHLPDFCNAIQGVIIFILFVCRPKVRRLIHNRLTCQTSDANGLSTTQTERQPEEIALRPF